MTLDELFHERETSIDGKDVPFTFASKLPLSPCSRRTSSSTTTTTGFELAEVDGVGVDDTDGVADAEAVADADAAGDTLVAEADAAPNSADAEGLAVDGVDVDVVGLDEDVGAEVAESADAHFSKSAKAGSVGKSAFSISRS